MSEQEEPIKDDYKSPPPLRSYKIKYTADKDSSAAYERLEDAFHKHYRNGVKNGLREARAYLGALYQASGNDPTLAGAIRFFDERYGTGGKDEVHEGI